MWKIAGHSLKPCEKVFTSLTVEAPHDRVEIPLFLASGAEDGPTVFLVSGEHGSELTGPETVRRFFETLPVEKMRGNVAAVPVANPLAVRSKQHSYPYEKWAWFCGINDFNRLWPGKPDGNVAECTTYRLFHDIMQHSNAVVSLHSTNYRPYLLYMPGDDESKNICLAYGRIPLIYPVSHIGSSVQCARELCNIPAILLEWAPLRHVNNTAANESIIGLTNILIHLGMLDGEIRKISDQYILDYTAEKRMDITAVEDGILVREKAWGESVKEGEVVARLYDLYRYREVQAIVAPFDGIFNNSGPNPPHLATFVMHTDSVVKGELIASFCRYEEHIENPDGDEWRHLMHGGPNSSIDCPFQ